LAEENVQLLLKYIKEGRSVDESLEPKLEDYEEVE
jgi:hypothetical protein